eukprot:CAMPEP_0182557750 /NCGR_PEP_ID=MMETSP1324-20130603/1553_1 /TAXON_ID=236786 /ORGANISM="Florenciella sp., Strain RCC1587" /LENGTH=79 /DNA_ID=CAMNT_0024769849 /DNA_START=48 /DNA_END=283 /DNA_ORIENTATION=+
MKFTGNIDVLKGMQIKELDLGGCRNLEGNIEVFEGMQLKELNLNYCKNVEGEITPQMVEWLSSIEEKNLNDCGKLVLSG